MVDSLRTQEAVSCASLNSCYLRAADMNALEAAIAKVEREIDQVEGDTNTAVEQGRADDARQLRRKEEQLRRKEEQLREKELIALRAPGKQYPLKIEQYLVLVSKCSVNKDICCYLASEANHNPWNPGHYG